MLKEGVQNISQLFIMNDGFWKLLFKLLKDLDLFPFNLDLPVFQNLLENEMDGVRFVDRGIHLYVIQKAIENGIDLFNIFGHDSIEIIAEFRIVKSFSQQLGKCLDGDEGVSNPVDQFNEEEGQGRGREVLRHPVPFR